MYKIAFPIGLSGGLNEMTTSSASPSIRLAGKAAFALIGGESHWLAKISQPALWPQMGPDTCVDASVAFIFRRAVAGSRGGESMRNLLSSP